MSRYGSEAASASGDSSRPGAGQAEPSAHEPGSAPRSMAGGAFLSAISRGTVTVAGAATTIVMAHLLGPAGFGSYSVALTLMTLLLVMTTLGAEHGIVYYVSSGRWNATAALHDTRLLALGCGALGVGAAALLRVIVPGAFHGLSVPVTIIAAASLPFALTWFYASYVSLAAERYEEYVLPLALQAVLALALSAGLAAAGGLAWGVVGLATSHVTTAVVRLLRRDGRRDRGDRGGAADRFEPIRRAIGFGVRGYIANALQIVNYRLDIFILNATVAGAAVGRYSVAVAVTAVIWVLPQALSDVLFARVAALSHGVGEAEAEALLRSETRALRHTTLITLLGSGVVAGGLLLLLVPVFGTAFQPSITLGLILLPGCALLAIVNPLSSMIVGRGHPNHMLTLALIVTPVTVVLYVVLIPALHARGAALASSLSYAGAFAVAIVMYRRLTGVNALAVMVPTREELADYRALAAGLRRSGG